LYDVHAADVIIHVTKSTSRKKGEIPALLDTEDMIRMAEPDWKSIYTYIVEFYKRIRELGMT